MRTPVAAATPAISGSQPRCAGGILSGRSSTEKVSAAPGGLTQGRPIRPRPAVCSSATRMAPSASPRAAQSSRSAFVEPVRGVTWTAVQGPPRLGSSRASRAWSSGCLLAGGGPGGGGPGGGGGLVTDRYP
jgi:hypothetical protein